MTYLSLDYSASGMRYVRHRYVPATYPRGVRFAPESGFGYRRNGGSVCSGIRKFTSIAFTETLKEAGVKISMDGRGRWVDNVMIERLWRTLKYNCVYLNAFETGSETRKGIGKWIRRYNEERPHSSLDDKMPYEAYWNLPKPGCSGKLAA